MTTTTTTGNAQDIYITMKCVRTHNVFPPTCMSVCVYYVCECVYLCVCTCVYVWERERVCVCISRCVFACVWERVCVSLSLSLSLSVCVREREIVCFSLSLFVCVCVCVCVCACVSEWDCDARARVSLFLLPLSLSLSLTSPSFFPSHSFLRLQRALFSTFFSYKSEATRRTSTWQPKISLFPILSILLPLSLFSVLSPTTLSLFLSFLDLSYSLCFFGPLNFILSFLTLSLTAFLSLSYYLSLFLFVSPFPSFSLSISLFLYKVEESESYCERHASTQVVVWEVVMSKERPNFLCEILTKKTDLFDYVIFTAWYLKNRHLFSFGRKYDDKKTVSK